MISVAEMRCIPYIDRSRNFVSIEGDGHPQAQPLDEIAKGLSGHSAFFHTDAAQGMDADAGDSHALRGLLNGVDAVLSAVPYPTNPAITEAAIRSPTCMVDLGGNTAIVRDQLSRSTEAADAIQDAILSRLATLAKAAADDGAGAK